MKVTLNFVQERETKGTVVYRETEPNGSGLIIDNNRDAHIGSLYIQKNKLNTPYPKGVSVTLEFN